MLKTIALLFAEYVHTFYGVNNCADCRCGQLTAIEIRHAKPMDVVQKPVKLRQRVSLLNLRKDPWQGRIEEKMLVKFQFYIDKMRGGVYTLCVKKIRRMLVQMKRKNNKAFTITELVIVIAVVAILAAVLIPTFSNVIEKANQSNDTVLVKNLNTALSSYEALNGKPSTMHEALTAVAEEGFLVEKLTPRSSGEILWEQTSNRFVLIKDNAIVFGDASTTANLGYTYWKIVKEMPTENTNNYSLYLADGFATEGALAVASGIDVGNNSDISINYTNETSTAQDVVFRTNGGTLTVNGELDTVSHYGSLATVDVQAVAGNSYHEYGTVSKNIKLTKGRVIIESSSNVSAIVVATTVISDVKIANNGENDVLIAAENADIVSSLNTIVTGKSEIYETVVSSDDFYGYIAEVNGVKYIDFTEAVIAANNDIDGGTVYLLHDIDHELTFELTEDWNLNEASTIDYVNFKPNSYKKRYFSYTIDNVVIKSKGESVSVAGLSFLVKATAQKVDFEVEGNKTDEEFYKMLYIDGLTFENIEFTEQTVLGSSTFAYSSVDNLTFLNCKFDMSNSTQQYHDAVVIKNPFSSQGGDLVFSRNLRFTDCVFENCRRSIDIGKSKDLVIEDCNFNNCTIGLNVGDVVSEFIFKDNTVNNGDSAITINNIANNYATSDYVTRITVTGNNFTNMKNSFICATSYDNGKSSGKSTYSIADNYWHCVDGTTPTKGFRIKSTYGPSQAQTVLDTAPRENLPN